MRRTRAVPVAAAFSATVLVMLLLTAAGCRGPEPVAAPFTAPPSRIEVRHFEGDVFGWSGSGGKEKPGAGDRSARLRVSLAALERQPADLLDPISTRANLIASSGRGQPWMAVPRLLEGTRVGPAPAVLAGTRSAPLGERSADIPPGSTWAISVGDPRTDSGPPASLTSWRHVGILVKNEGHDAGEKAVHVRIAVVKEDWAPPEQEPDEGPGATDAGPKWGTLELRREVVVLEDLGADAGPLLISIPFRFEGSPGESVAAIIEAAEGPPGTPPPEEKGSSAPWPSAVRIEPTAATGEAPDPAIAALSSTFHRRRALLFLARAGGSRFAEDIVLSSDETALARIAAKVIEGAGDGKGGVRPRAEIDLGWLAESGCLEAAAALLAEGKLPEGLKAILSIHAGEAGRDPSVLIEILRSASGRDDLARRILEENRIALEDPSPAARLRAFDWLGARGAAPAGFDPLAPAAERKAALEKAETPEGAPPAGAAVPEGGER